MSAAHDDLNALELRIIRLEAATREAMEQRDRLRRSSTSPLFMTPAQLAARTRQTAHLDMRKPS